MRDRLSLAFAVLLAASVATASSQTPATPQQPVFKGGVTLVTVDVVVVDKDGKPVPNLTAADFEVKFNNRVQRVRAVSFLQVGAGQPQPGQAPAVQPEASRQATSNQAPPPETRTFVILVDDLSLEPTRGKALFAAAQRFVGKLPEADLVGYATTSGPGAVNPTRDRGRIVAALKTAVGQFNDPRTLRPKGPANEQSDQPVGLQEAIDIDDGDPAQFRQVVIRECFNGDATEVNATSIEELIARNQCVSDLVVEVRRTAALVRQTLFRQVQGYLSVLKAMSVGGGIRHLILITDGVAISRDSSPLVQVARAAASSGVQVSVMLEEHDLSLKDQGRAALPAGVTPQADAGMTQRRREDNKMLISGANTLSDMTGGTFHRVVGTPDPFFDRVVLASSAVYRLGVESLPESAPGREFSLSARVLRPSGLTVRANKSAVVPGPVAVVPIEDQLKAAIGGAQTLYGLPITLGTSMRRGQNQAQIDLGVNVTIGASAKGPLTAMFGVVSAGGKLRSGRKIVEAPAGGGDYQLAFAVPLDPGTHILRFAVADAAGAVGSVQSSVTAQLQVVGPLKVSDLLTSWEDASGTAQVLALEDVPAGVESLNVTLELYPTAATQRPSDVSIRMGLFAAGQEKPVLSREPDPENRDGTWLAGALLPIAGLPAGRYTLRAAILMDGKEIGAVQTTIKKQ
jgi:VWFA-related protein